MKLKERKYHFVNRFAKAFGFHSLNDYKTIISRVNFPRALRFLQLHARELLRLFKNKRLQKRLRKHLTEADTIRLFKTLCRSVKRVVFSRKINVFINGRRTSRHVYRLCR